MKPQRKFKQTLTVSMLQAIDIWMGTCTAFVFAALVEFTFVNHTWRTKGRLPGIPTGLESRADYREMSQSNGNGDQNKNLLNLEEVFSYYTVTLSEEYTQHSQHSIAHTM